MKLPHPIFNQKYEMLRQVGQGETSKVYLCRALDNPEHKVTLKIMYKEKAEQLFCWEAEIHRTLLHPHIGFLSSGSDGQIQKKTGRVINGLHFILLKHNAGDLCKSLGGMVEDTGRFFLNQQTIPQVNTTHTSDSALQHLTKRMHSLQPQSLQNSQVAHEAMLTKGKQSPIVLASSLQLNRLLMQHRRQYKAASKIQAVRQLTTPAYGLAPPMMPEKIMYQPVKRQRLHDQTPLPLANPPHFFSSPLNMGNMQQSPDAHAVQSGQDPTNTSENASSTVETAPEPVDQLLQGKGLQDSTNGMIKSMHERIFGNQDASQKSLMELAKLLAHVSDVIRSTKNHSDEISMNK